MKSFRHIYKFAFALPILMLAGCSDDNEPAAAGSGDLDGDAPSELTLTLSVPDHEVVNLGTRAADPAIKSVTVFCYDQTGTTGNHLEHTTLTSGWETASGGYKITVPIHRLTKSVHLVVNANVAPNATDPSQIASNDVNAGIMWGRADLKDIIQKGSSITMLRNTAKVSVKSDVSGFLSRFGVIGTSNMGSVAPSGWNINPTAPTIPARAAASTSLGLQESSGEVNVFETLADSPKAGSTEEYTTRGRIIIEGTYKGVTGYYVVAFRTRNGSGPSETPGNYRYTPIPVIRNHHYIVNVKEVRAEGWQTISEAMTAEPDNRLTVEITDKTPEITDIIADRDYMLGVGDDVKVTWDATTAQINVATSWDGTHDSTGKPYEITVTGAGMSWVTTSGITEESHTVTDYGTTGAKITTYVLNVPITQNSTSNIERTAELTVRSGDLTRTVKIIQSGRNYKRDPNRAVTMVMSNGVDKTISDWFSFVDNECKGLLPENSHTGAARNDGLIFPAVPAYNVVYYIPKLDGDKSARIPTGGFSVTTEQYNGKTYYRVHANASLGQGNFSTPTIAVGELQITNKENAVIHYPLYQTGYLHELTSSTSAYQRENEKINGWFYYEVVKVGNNYILDRNLGATSNKPYITTYAGFKDNKDAIGAYFKIATVKSTDKNNATTILNNLNVSRFIIPSEDQVSAWGIRTANVSGTSGENARVATITTSGGQYNTVYIPHGGYYEATSPKYETHANIWTRTLVSGNQGFDPQLSPEFGYWYRYLDVYGSKVNFGQMRFANGSGGMARTDNSVFKYMPLRLMWQ